MAAALEMGEVDDIHMKEENVTEGVVMNGEVAEEERAEKVLEAMDDNEEEDIEDEEEEEHHEEQPEQTMDVDEDGGEVDTEEGEDEEIKEDKELSEGNSSADDTAISVASADESSQEEPEENLTHKEENSIDKDEENDEDEEAKLSDDETKVSDEAKLSDYEAKLSDDEAKLSDEGTKLSDEEAKLSDEDVKVSDEEVKVSDEEAKLSDEVKLSDEEAKVSDEEAKASDNEEMKAEEVKSDEKVDEVHNVDDNSDDDVQITKTNSVKDPLDDQPVVLNDSNECDDVMIVDGDVKENGTENPEIIDLATTPVKKSNDGTVKSNSTPRRSTRNLNKSKTYIDISDKDAPSDYESDVEEVLPQDPLADPLAVIPNDKKKQRSSATIVVKDTKRLVEIASKTNTSNSGKKEPTLVIIDTNSILSGRGPVPITQKPSAPPSFPVLPVALPAQGVYPANMRATITPIPMTNQKSSNSTSSPQTQQAPILPSLTDDMFVVEAPSFIVPYVYEKPPVKDLKGFIKNMAEEIKKMLEEDEDKDEKENEDEKMEVEEVVEEKKEEEKKGKTYFDSPIGKFFVDIGSSLVQEYVQTDLLKQQKRKRDREGGQNSTTTKTIQSLLKSLEYTKENNHPYKMTMKKCEFCSYKTESSLAMAFHLETPHMKNFVYRCNFCSYEVRSPHDILFHMEAEHCVRGRLERAPAFHQCPNCPFEDNQKGKLSRHSVACARKFKPERNLEPPIDWEPPAKIPRAPRMKQQQSLSTTAAMYQAMAKNSQMQFMKIQQHSAAQSALNRGRGRPTMPMPSKQSQGRSQGLVYKQAVPGGASVLVPTNYQISGNQLYQNSSSKQKTVHQPSISITPLPRPSSTSGGSSSATALANAAMPAGGAKPGDSNSKNAFVICEICDGYIKDLEQLRNHMQWIHKVKIHPKMIYNRPPLNCQKCQFRFFTDQGLERHLLGSHGLVTSSMQEAANKCKDSGRCPVCGRVYQWKLLNHVARDHNMTLKPAHLSYKCTVCTATFGMYKQFENHVYSAHSVVAKRSMDKKSSNSSPTGASSATAGPVKSDSLLKPLKINDEITIIPQMPKSNGAGSSKEGSPSTSKNTPGTSKIGDTSITRAERLARRKTSLVGDNN